MNNQALALADPADFGCSSRPWLVQSSLDCFSLALPGWTLTLAGLVILGPNWSSPDWRVRAAIFQSLTLVPTRFCTGDVTVTLLRKLEGGGSLSVRVKWPSGLGRRAASLHTLYTILGWSLFSNFRFFTSEGLDKV